MVLLAYPKPSSLQGCEDCNLYWFEEPISPDNKIGTAEVRANTFIPIAAGESEYTAFDVLRFNSRTCVRCVTTRLRHNWRYYRSHAGFTIGTYLSTGIGTALLGISIFIYGGTFGGIRFPSANVIEFSLGGNPMMYDLVEEQITVDNEGMLNAPTKPGLGLTPNWDFVKDFKQ